MSLKLEKIYRKFKTSSANYIHFKIQQSQWDYLSVQYEDHSKYSLFYGKNFDEQLQQYLQDSSTDCIECQLGTNIQGGISFDNGELVYFNFSVEKANKILQILNDESQSLIYFRENNKHGF